MTTRAEEDRLRQEMGERFLKQMADMFTQTRTDLAAQFIPRQEAEARFDHLEQVVERIGLAMEKLAGNVATSNENAPRIYADRVDTKQDMAELRVEIEKLKTARETDIQRGYGYRIEDMQGRYQGDERTERGWRVNSQRQNSQVVTWIIASAAVLLTFLGVATTIVTLIVTGH